MAISDPYHSGPRSIGQVLDAHKGFAPGFDFLRIALSLSVLWFHTFVVLNLADGLQNDTAAWLYIASILPMFFALSGFLIAGSAQRLRLGDFLINRGLRIVPALAIEITISAGILGLIFTTLPIRAYFADPKFIHYFTNIIGWIQYELPGVFVGNPDSGVVNLSLWTVPFEIACYVLMSFVILLRIPSKPWLILVLAGAFLFIPVAFTAVGLARNGGIGLLGSENNFVLKAADHLLFKNGGLFSAFLLGIAAYYYRYRIPFSPRLAAAAVVIGVVVALIGNQGWFWRYEFHIAFIPVIVYLTVFIGACSIPRVPFYSRGDYSYGIYLYGFPLQQSLVALFPGQSWILNFCGSVVVATAMATLSWHWIEKPILKQRKRFSFVGRRIAAEEREQAARPPVVAAPLILGGTVSDEAD